MGNKKEHLIISGEQHQILLEVKEKVTKKSSAVRKPSLQGIVFDILALGIAAYCEKNEIKLKGKKDMPIIDIIEETTQE